MTKKVFNVVFSLSYTIRAEDQKDAIDEAENKFIEEVGNQHSGLTELFGVNAEKIEETS